MPDMTHIRRARRMRHCTECRLPIFAGELYLDAACPPWSDLNSTRPRRWWVIRACARCCDRYALHTSRTRDLFAQRSTRTA